MYLPMRTKGAARIYDGAKQTILCLYRKLYLRMCTVQPILLSVVDIENSCSFWTVFRKILNELQDRSNSHSVIRRSRCCRHRVVMCREKHSVPVVRGIFKATAFDLDKNICALKVRSVCWTCPRAIAHKVVRNMHVLEFFDERKKLRQQILANIVVRMRIVWMRSCCDLPSR